MDRTDKYYLRTLKLKGKKHCDCGYEFTANDITELIPNTDYQYYGGRVGYYSVVQCKECGKEKVLLLEPYNNSYRTIDIGEEERIVDTNKTVNNEQEETTIVNMEVPNKDSLICHKCNKTFKSIQGLKRHEKTCNGI